MKNLNMLMILLILVSPNFVTAQKIETIVLQFGYPPNGLIVRKVLPDDNVFEHKYVNDRKNNYDFTLIYKVEIDKIINQGFELLHSSTLQLSIDGSTTQQNFIFIRRNNDD